MLAHLVPGPLVRIFARPYVAGESLDEALRVARGLLDDDLILTTLDLLGEAVTDPDEVQSNIDMYRRTIDAVAGDSRFRRSGYRPWGSAVPSVSLKPSAFSFDAMEDATGPITGLAEYASERGVALTIDMEDRRYTDYTLDLAVGLFRRGLDVGTVLQTRLHRTPDDLARIPEGMRLRLVIGIYPEPPEVAIQSKPEMKERMLTAADQLLAQGVKVEFATHDERYLERFLREVAPKAPESCELQLLLGVPRASFIERMRQNVYGVMLPVRLYVPFADNWDDATAYLRRRMAESPSMVWLVLRNLLPRRR